MRRNSFIALFAPTVLIGLSASPIFAQTTSKVGPDSKTSTSPASDSTPPASNGSSSAAPTTLPADADPTAPGLTPAERRAASQAHLAFVKAQVAANKAEAAANVAQAAANKDANKEQYAAMNKRLDEELTRIEQTTFTPDHETLNKASYQAMFKMDAFTALNQALAIQARTTHPTMTASETALFQALHSGQTGKYTFAEAALIASGVDDYNQRAQYMAKINQLVADAKVETDKQTTIRGKATAICNYLFAGPMKAGYDDDTFSLAQVLDNGHFNCISSVVMFVVVAHGVGLDAGAVVEPSHIVARVPTYDVQTTSGRIYQSIFRLSDIHDQKYNSEQMNLFDPAHPYHEVADFGILLEIYQNFANHASDNKQSDVAAIGVLKEVFLDPTMPCAGHDLKLFLNDWFNAASTSNDVTTAVAIAQLYRQMARDPEAANEMDQCVVYLKRQRASH